MSSKHTSAAVALAWLRARPGTVVPIIGARRLAHLEDNLAAVDVDADARAARVGSTRCRRRR